MKCSPSDSHRHAASDHLALSALLCAPGWETAAPDDEGGGLRHTHGGQVAPGHVQERLSAHTPGLRHILWFVCLYMLNKHLREHKFSYCCTVTLLCFWSVIQKIKMLIFFIYMNLYHLTNDHHSSVIQSLTLSSIHNISIPKNSHIQYKHLYHIALTQLCIISSIDLINF